ncbi:uncharacterized protein JN550_012674 [Neoarthrinium moseri]|uniref:uncharacterized protein n=1 Tax=Neoarthrinium moseri TaxID=1658444 RepID=UPI001FDCA450|nr:uncharacterized protein JN550_012674 [Neoarthrinium moseri]KAI1858390.1 hypothetical protein JN550_012674 [Neoarthrinium moseri]
MANFTHLPTELVLEIANCLDKCGDWARLAAVCRSFNVFFGGLLWDQLRGEDLQRLLCWAVTSGNISVAQRVLSMQVHPNFTIHSWSNLYRNELLFPSQPDSSLEDRFARAHLDVWRCGLSGLSFAPYGLFTWTPLHLASMNGSHDLVDLLIRHGAQIDAICNAYCDCHPDDGAWSISWAANNCLTSPLQTALHLGRESTANLLLLRGASLNPSADGGITGKPPLHLAAQYGLLSVLKTILNQFPGFDVNQQDRLGHTALVYAFFGRKWACFWFLLKKGADIKVRVQSHEDYKEMTGKDRMSLLESACVLGWYDIAVQLIETGVDVPKTSPFLHACMARYTFAPYPYAFRFVSSPEYDSSLSILIETLVLNGADLNQPLSRIGTPLYMSVQIGALEVTEALLKAGADIDAKTGTGKTLLDAVCHAKPCFAMFKLLLSRGALKTSDFLKISSLIKICKHLFQALCQKTSKV